jgi:hypothetical protein
MSDIMLGCAAWVRSVLVSLPPITWPLFMVGYRDNPNMFAGFYSEENTVGETRHKRLADFVAN